MNIHEVAKRLRKLGIPGKEKEKAVKKNLVIQEGTRLEDVLSKRIEKNLVRWAYDQEVIDPPTKPGGQGRSQMADWHPDTIEQAATVWAVRDRYRVEEGENKKLKKDQIDVVRRIVSRLEKDPVVVYTPPTVVGPFFKLKINTEDISRTFVSDDCDGLELFPGADNKERAECLNKLVISWIAAKEKVREFQFRGIASQIEGSKWEEFIPAEINFSQFDPWAEDIKCPWRLDRPALVELYYWSRPPKDGKSSYGRWPFKWERSLRDAKHDDVIVYEDGVDPREFFTIDVGDRQRWARSELKTINRLMKENERTLRRIGIKPRGERLPVTSECYDTLPLEKKNAVDEWVGLRSRRAKLKTRFGA